MKKPMKQCIFGALVVVMGLSVCACGKEKKKEEQTTNQLFLLREVREEAEETMEKAYSGAYKNLTFDKFTPTITTEDSVSEMKQEGTEYGDLSKTTQECVKEQYESICAWLGEKEVDKTKIMDLKSEDTLDRVEEMLQDGTYPESKAIEDGLGKPELRYQDEKKNIYILVNSGWCYYDVTLDRKYDDPFVGIEKYNANLEDDQLEKSYPLEDGECSLQEAIQFAENYQNKERPIPCGKDFSVEAEKIKVCQYEDGSYGYDILMHRVYKGTPFIGLYEGSSIVNQRLSYDMGIFYMTNRSRPSTCMALGANEIMTVNGKTYTEIISLDRVFTLISEKLGKNAKCKIMNACLAYQQTDNERQITENGYVDICQVKPVWYVELQNATDERITQVFIELQDYEGENIVTNRIK